MISVRADLVAPIQMDVRVSGMALYLDQFAILDVARGESDRRRRFIAALQAGGDLLFSLTNAVEISALTGSSAMAVRAFLDDIGPHWAPIDVDPQKVLAREAHGGGADAYIAADVADAFFKARLGAFADGAIVDMSSDTFFRLSAFLDWLAPHRATFLQRALELDQALITSVTATIAEHRKTPEVLANLQPVPFNPAHPVSFAFHNLRLLLVKEARAFQLKKGDGRDFLHAAIGAALASAATLDKQWKRRILSLPQPNGLARIYTGAELGLLVTDLEGAVSAARAAGTHRSR